MRALYLLLADTIGQLRYLHYALAAILVFIAFKLSAERWISILLLVSVGIIVVAIVAAVAPSLHARGKHSGRQARPTASEE
jgi:tellurite resistance protein TerC